MVRGFQIGDDNMYISAHISYDGKSAEIDFPVIDDLLNDILTESKMPTDTTLPFFVEDIHYPSELSMLNAKDINLDELNFLAKRLDSFTDDELEQFYVAAEHENFKTLKELINLTYNLDKFTVIKDVSDMAKVGRAYTLNTEGSVPADSRYDAKYAEIGRKLLGSGRGIFTEHGLLFVEDKPMDAVYDGRVLPGFAYKDFIVNVDLTYKGRCESLFLPESMLAIDKAVRRLGAASIEDCECTYEFENPNYGRFAVKFEDILDNEGIGGLNALAYQFYTYGVDTEKLDAAIEMTGVTSSKNIITLINYLDDLELITDIDKYDFAGVGRYYLDQSTDLEISPDLLDFFDFEKFGEYIAEEYSGHFTSCGFLYYDGANYMSEIENALEDESSGMQFGGM